MRSRRGLQRDGREDDRKITARGKQKNHGKITARVSPEWDKVRVRVKQKLGQG